jgi:hypothetical protein
VHDLFFLPFYPYPLQKSVCGQLLIRSILVLLFSFDVPQKKYQKKLQQKEKIEKEKETSDNKEGALCVFSFCFYGGAL